MIAPEIRAAQREQVFATQAELELTPRAAAWGEFFSANPNVHWSDGLNNFTVYDGAAAGKLAHFWVEVTRGGRVIYEDDHVAVNPPAGEIMDALQANVRRAVQ